MSKYIDLEEQIVDDSHAHRQSIFSNDARVVLRWLDDHADQVPGRTITASEFDEAVESCITEDATVPPHKFAERLGVVCVPDPEPTNAERWEKFYGVLGVDLAPWQISYLSDAMDKRGVKAPGGDDE